MKPKNLISTLQGDRALNILDRNIGKEFKTLKSHEIRVLDAFCKDMISYGCEVGDFDGFFVSYEIPQISKEFDLLRFGVDCVLNIELKSELKVANKHQKIFDQLRKNEYYLKFLGKPTKIFAYVENDGYYSYTPEDNKIEHIAPHVLSVYMKTMVPDYTADPDRMFIPSNYLVSPFNATAQFIKGEYFLTSAQQKIREEFLGEAEKQELSFFCISANAGTGKTLLLYDIAKEILNRGKHVKIIHCGLLNEGHKLLRDNYSWDIVPIRNISSQSEFIDLCGCDYVFIDESQRIRQGQLDALTKKAVDCQIPLLFSFDVKQYLRGGETQNLTEYLENGFPGLTTITRKLTNKIRTNKAMASFITNLLNIGRSKDNLDYSGVSVEYFGDSLDLKSYIAFLELKGWVPITYTTSQYDIDPYEQLSGICEKNAHAVIGQEFSKVAFVLDQNFSYDETGALTAHPSYYSARGMLYQIVTRVVDELKVIVFNNPPLYLKILEIKSMGK